VCFIFHIVITTVINCHDCHRHVPIDDGDDKNDDNVYNSEGGDNHDDDNELTII